MLKRKNSQYITNIEPYPKRYKISNSNSSNKRKNYQINFLCDKIKKTDLNKHTYNEMDEFYFLYN